MRVLDTFTVIESQKIAGAVFDIVRYDKLQGSDDLQVAEKIFLQTKPTSILRW
jgi:hypothetical protein